MAQVESPDGELGVKAVMGPGCLAELQVTVGGGGSIDTVYTVYRYCVDTV